MKKFCNRYAWLECISKRMIGNRVNLFGSNVSSLGGRLCAECFLASTRSTHLLFVHGKSFKIHKYFFSKSERVPSTTGKSSSGASSRSTARTRSPVKRERGSRPPSASTASSSVAPSPAPVTSGLSTGRKTTGTERLRKDSAGGNSKENDNTTQKDTSTRRQRPSKYKDKSILSVVRLKYRKERVAFKSRYV